jgi:hypothetical protein
LGTPPSDVTWLKAQPRGKKISFFSSDNTTSRLEKKKKKPKVTKLHVYRSTHFTFQKIPCASWTNFFHPSSSSRHFTFQNTLCLMDENFPSKLLKRPFHFSKHHVLHGWKNFIQVLEPGLPLLNEEYMLKWVAYTPHWSRLVFKRQQVSLCPDTLCPGTGWLPVFHVSSDVVSRFHHEIIFNFQ